MAYLSNVDCDLAGSINRIRHSSQSLYTTNHYNSLGTKENFTVGYKLQDCHLEPPYRYSLTSVTDSLSEQVLIIIQCNPSEATTEQSDPTAGKVSIWAEENNFGKVVFLNLFSIISSKKSILSGKSYEEIVGSKNDTVLKTLLRETDATVVLAWGADIPIEKNFYYRRIAEIKALLEKSGNIAHHVGALSYGTHPRHGRMWNKGYRKIQVLSWEAIGA